MVGVPGRSRGCSTCRRRRIKCGKSNLSCTGTLLTWAVDEAKPVCGRCTKTGIACGGYARPLQIVYSGITPRGHPSAQRTRGPQQTPYGKMYSLEGLAASIPQYMSVAAFRDTMHFAHLFDDLLWRSYGSPWLQESAQGKLGQLSYDACASLSQRCFGHRFQQPVLDKGSALVYDRVLSSLRVSISSAEQANPTSLTPVLILVARASASSSVEEAVCHVNGMAALLQACGPCVFANEDLHQTFRSARATIVSNSLLSCKRTFLEEHLWQSEPFSRSFTGKCNEDQLIDVLATVPGIYEDLIASATWAEPMEDVVEQTVTTIEAGLCRLLQWRKDWEAIFPSAAWEAQRDASRTVPQTRTNYPSGAERMLCYNNFTRAIESSLYDAVIMLLVDTLTDRRIPRPLVEKVQRFLHEHFLHASNAPNVPENALLPIPSLWDTRSLAKEIIRSFEYQLQHIGACHESTLFWLFPLALATQFLQHDEAWSRWAHEMLRRSRNTYGEPNSLLERFILGDYRLGAWDG